MFFAPEMFLRRETNVKVRGEKTDLWALGITIYYLLTGKYPCEDAKDPLHLKTLIVEREIDFSIIKNDDAREVIKSLL
jgi:serine/threonine protein kinase